VKFQLPGCPPRVAPLNKHITTNIVSTHQTLVQAIELFLVIEIEDQMSRVAICRHLKRHSGSNVLLQLVNGSQAVWIRRFALCVYSSAAPSASSHPFELPDS
jgi:hypothetical protein